MIVSMEEETARRILEEEKEIDKAENIRTGFILGAAWYICQKEHVQTLVDEQRYREIAEMLGVTRDLVRGRDVEAYKVEAAKETADWVYSEFVNGIF